MLFQVEMDVRIPIGFDEKKLDELKETEKARAQELQRQGKWRHLWRVVGQYRNTSIFDVESGAELHELLTGLPLFPFMEIKVTALCRHPSSIHDDDR
ncbi:MAG TPA: muconolactone Delta-isomerase [Allosphingosinicella sp.]